MSFWRIHTWEEVERLAALNNTCISPNRSSYEAAKLDFDMPNVVYFGFTYVAFSRALESYLRAVLLDKYGMSAFLDYYTIRSGDMEDFYSMLRGIALSIRHDGVEHFYIVNHQYERGMFPHAVVRELEIKTDDPLPKHRSEIRCSTYHSYIDILSY